MACVQPWCRSARGGRRASGEPRAVQAAANHPSQRDDEPARGRTCCRAAVSPPLSSRVGARRGRCGRGASTPLIFRQRSGQTGGGVGASSALARDMCGARAWGARRRAEDRHSDWVRPFCGGRLAPARPPHFSRVTLAQTHARSGPAEAVWPTWWSRAAARRRRAAAAPPARAPGTATPTRRFRRPRRRARGPARDCARHAAAPACAPAAHAAAQRAAVLQARGVARADATPCRRLAPRSQAEVFEELPTEEFAFEGIPTVPPRKDMEHFAFFCDGCRYRRVLGRAARSARPRADTRCPARSVKGSITETAATIKRRLWEGGCGRGGDMTTGKRKVISRRGHVRRFADACGRCARAPAGGAPRRACRAALRRAARAQLGGNRAHLRRPADG